jgi:hypothetical protein
MKKETLNISLTLLTLGLFALNFTPAFAQITMIDILGGGYRLQSPSPLTFNDVTAAFTDQATTIEFRGDLNDYLLITDENGGNDFNVSVEATDFTDIVTAATIPTDNFEIKNYDGAANPIIAANSLTTLTGVALDPSTDNFVSFPVGTPVTLFTSDGHAPGSWKIFPVLRLTIPANTLPGDYASTVTFTIN